MNKCMRCKREIKDIRARYGPVCAKIMGVDQQYYRSKLNNRQTAFLQGVSLAKKNLANPAVDTSKIDTKAYMNAMGKYMATLSGNKMDEAVKELQEAKKILDTPKSPPNIDDVVKQINKLNSKTPDFIKNIQDKETSEKQQTKEEAKKDPVVEPNRAEKTIQDNSEYIIKAAQVYDVDPAIIAGVIYTEQVKNVNIFDILDGYMGFYGILDTSIGIGQVKVSTAKFIEEKGYITHSKYYRTKLFGYQVMGTDNMIRAKRLADNEENIMYIAAYLKYFQDIWGVNIKI